jgi:hypothetical protein
MSNIVNQTQAATRAARSGVATHNVGAAASTGQVTASYPRQGFSKESPKDELMRIKTQMIQQSGGPNTPFGMVYASDSDFQRMQELREAEQLANLDAWIGQNFHTNDVTTRAWLQKVWPEYYNAREREMIDRAKFALRVNLVLLRGPKNEKDLILQWGLATGQIQLDRNWNVIGAHLNAGQPMNPNVEQARFANSLFSPKRYLTDAERLASATMAENPFRSIPGPNRDAMAQLPAPFASGQAVANRRYPNFLANVVTPAL